MIFEAISLTSLKVLGEFLVLVQGQFNRLKGSPQKRLSRIMLSLFDIMHEVEESAFDVINLVDKLESETSKNMRSEIIDDIEMALRRLSHNAECFMEWFYHNREFTGVLDILSPKSRDFIKQVVGSDPSYIRSNEESGEFYQRIEELKVYIYKTGKLKDKALLKKLRNDLRSICGKLDKARDHLREFAVANLRVIDFFQRE